MQPCHLVWDGVSIDRRADVYACCLLKPSVLGNLRDSPLHEIINGPTARLHRAESRDGRLACRANCHLLTPDSPGPATLDDEVRYESLRSLHLGFGDACNIDCIMCRRAVGDFTTLSSDLLVERVDVTPFTEVAIQGGEPLAIRECRRYLTHLAAVGKRYILLTNGLLIDGETARDLARHAAKVVVSINGATRDVHELVNAGSSWSRVLDNVARLRAERDASGSALEIVARVTIVPENLVDVPLALRTFEQLGFDTINFGFDRRTVPLRLARDPEATSRLRAAIRSELSEAPADRVDAHRLALLGLV
ncbi:MAG: hypothetical protein JWM10_3032 [Myxococcaceae bacterium]|nr:hypothetical protein [Myxococcaceae bacterium]